MTPAEVQSQLDKFNTELDKINQKIVDSGDDLSTGLVTSLSKAVAEARNLSAPLASASSLTSKLNKLQVENESLIIRRKVAEQSYVKALAEGTAEQQLNTLNALKTASANLKITQGLEDQLRTLQGIAETQEKSTNELKKQNNLSSLLSNKLKGAFEPLTKLATVSGIFDAIVSGMVRADKTSVDLSKNLGIGSVDAYKMTVSMQGMALASSNVNVTMKNMVTAMTDLNTATGLVADYSADTLETQIMLTKQFGLTGEEAAGIYKFSVLTGKSSSTINDEMVGAFVATRNSAKVGANFKAVMAEAAKVSGQLAANFKNNPAAITAAIVQMKALGTSLEQTKNQGATLLDFESSIENELKAELLTGEQLNLEKARAAALMGDQVALAEELSNQGMTLEKFSSMNVLAQDAYAKAVGLNSDQLSDQLTKQKMAVESGKSLAEITKDDALAAQKRQDVQDRFNAAIEKLQDLFGTIGTLLSPILSVFSYLIGNSYVLYGILGLWLARTLLIGGGFKGMLGSIKSMGTGIINKVMGKGAAAATTTAEKTATMASGGGGGTGEGIKTKMINIAEGIKAFGNTKVLFGALNLIPASIGLIAFIPGILGAKLVEQINGPKFQTSMEGLASGVAAMGKGKVFLGSLGLIAASVGLIAMIPGVIGGLLLGASASFIAVGLEILGAGLEAFGIIAATGMPFLGILLLAAFGAALIPFGYALNLAVPAIEAFGNVILKVFTGIGIVIKAAAEGLSTLFTSLGSVDIAHLLAIGPALIMVGLGLAALGAGGIVGAIGTFLNGDPIKKIERLAASGDGLQKASTGLQAMAGALTQVSSALSSIDVSKLEALDKFASNRASESVVGGIVDFITAPIKAIGSMVEGAGGNDNTGMIKAINEVRDAVNKLYAKDQSINMDGKKVGTTLVQSSYKVA